MSIPNDSVKNVLDYFDNLEEKFSDHKISEAIRHVPKTTDNEFEIKAEGMAFDFSENYRDKDANWGTYHGPLAIFRGEDGKMYESPSIKLVTEDMVTYWESRAEKSKHPILKARYADLVWDLKKKICNAKPDYAFALIAIDSKIEIANRDLYEYDIFVITKLERALELALKLKKQEKINLAKEAFFNFEKKLAVDDKPGTWGFVYDSLVQENDIATTEEKELIIKSLETRMTHILEDENIVPTAIEGCVLRLAQYYKANQNKNELTRVLKNFEDAYYKKSEGSAMRALFSLEKIYEVYIQYEFFQDAERILQQIHEISPRTLDEMQTITFEQEINVIELNDFIENLVSGSIDEASSKLVGYFTPKKAHIENQIRDLAQKAPLTFLARNSVINKTGRKIAEIASLNEEQGPEDRIAYQISQNLSYESHFLGIGIDKLVEKFQLNSELLFKELTKSPAFSDCRKDLLQLGIEQYFNKHYIVSSHILIPQIEHSFRTVLKLSGGFELKTKRSQHGGFEIKPLGAILADQYISNIFGEDTLLYLKVLLVDQRGWNIRNDICHGLISSEYFDKAVADRVLHVLLCLGRIRLKIT
jgi:Domain of unknown function (DUF4209)